MRGVALAAALLLATVAADAATVTGLTLSGTVHPTVTIALAGTAGTVKAFALADPRRLVIDLAGTSADRRDVAGPGAATKARIGQFDPDTARLVIDLGRPMRLESAVAGDRTVVLTLAASDAASFDREVRRGRHVVIAAAPPPADAPPRAAPPPVAVTGTASDFDLPADALVGAPPARAPATAVVIPPPRRGARRPLVVIDPGHGGKDTGTISVMDGAYEKNVVLAIARRAAAELEKSGLVRVKLTREDDTFIPLPQRVAIARAAHADLFVSIHADSAPNPEARGASVYTLSQTASDAVAARLAARENKSDIIAGVNLGIDAPDVGDILIDLVQRDTMNVSVAFAETLQSKLDDRIGFRGEFHHFAGFRVLKAADVPSVLLETGYLSNADDARTLLSKDGQRRIGEGVARAVEAHFARSRRVAGSDPGPHMGGVKPNGG